MDLRGAVFLAAVIASGSGLKGLSFVAGPNGNECFYPGDELRPHQTDCTKFLQCAHGNEYEHQCLPELRFNPKIYVCDWVNNVPDEDCPGSGPTTTETTTTSTKPTTTTTTTITTTTTTTTTSTTTTTTTPSTTTTTTTTTSATTTTTTSPSTAFDRYSCKYDSQLLPNLEDPTNATYINCYCPTPEPGEPYGCIPMIQKCGDDLFFVEERQMCWYKCIDPPENTCSKYVCNQRPCEGERWFSDRNNCSYFWTCYQDEFLSNWQYCRHRCSVIKNHLGVFHYGKQCCVRPFVNLSCEVLFGPNVLTADCSQLGQQSNFLGQSII